MRNLVSHSIGILLLLICCVSWGDIEVVIANNYDLEFSQQEKDAIPEVLSRLTRNPSPQLINAIESNDGFAIMLDRREEPRDGNDLEMMVHFEEVQANDFRTVHPTVLCEGTYQPTSWHYCWETSNLFLTLPGYNRIHINHESITFDSATRMYTFLDNADLISPAGFSLSSKGIHNFLYNSRAGLYHLMGQTPIGESYTVHLRVTEESGDQFSYEIADWSCQ